MLPAGSCHSEYKAVIQDKCWSLLAYIRLNLVLNMAMVANQLNYNMVLPNKNGSTDFEIEDAQKYNKIGNVHVTQHTGTFL